MERIFVVVEDVAFRLMMERIFMLARVPVVSARRYTSVMCSSTPQMAPPVDRPFLGGLGPIVRRLGVD